MGVIETTEHMRKTTALLYTRYIFRIALFIFIFLWLGRESSRLYTRLYDINRSITYIHPRKVLHPLTIEKKRVGGRENPRIPGPASGRCSDASYGPCLFACSTSLPAPFRAVSTWYSHKRDQPNSARCCYRSDYVLLIRTQPKNMNHNA